MPKVAQKVSYADLYKPILEILSDKVPRHRNVIIRELAKGLRLDQADIDYIGQEGGDVVGHITHRLKCAGLITRHRGVSSIAEDGLAFFKKNVQEITLEMIKSFAACRNTSL